MVTPAGNLDAGLILQVDFPMLVSRWDTASRTMSLADYRKWAEGRIAYLSYALRGLPEDRIRFHTCYGVNFGPRVSDLQLENILDLIFTIPAGAYSWEQVLRAVEAVAAGHAIFGPSVAERLTAVFAASAARPRLPELTARESDILELMAERLSNAAIAARGSFV